MSTDVIKIISDEIEELENQQKASAKVEHFIQAHNAEMKIEALKKVLFLIKEFVDD